MIDLEELGAQCALESCNERDFLPIQCSCLKLFCRFHISPDSHGCAAARQPATTKSQPGLVTRPKCAFPGCNKPSLIISPPMTDQADSGEERAAAAWSSFCVDHRHEKSSLLSGTSDGDNHVPVQDLARHLPVHSSCTPVAVRSAKLPTDPAKLAHLQKVNMMKMRHKAVPGDPKDKGSIPVGQRLHVNVRYEADGSKESILWFRRSIVVGRILDLLASHFNIPSSKVLTLSLHKIPPVDDGEPLALQNHQPLGEQIDDGSHLVLSA